MVQIRGTEVRVTIPIFPETARGSWGVVEGKSLKAGNKNKTTTKKIKPQNWDSKDRSWTPEVELGAEGTATKTCTEVGRVAAAAHGGRRQGRQAMVV